MISNSNMETKYEFEMKGKSSLSKENVNFRNTDEAEVPLLSVTAPSEDVSEVEDNLGTSTLQSPSCEGSNGARSEAERIVGDVLSKASQILENSPSAGAMSDFSEKTEIIVTSSDDNNIRDDDWTTDASHVSDELETVIELSIYGLKDKNISEDIRNVADEFVKRILGLAVEEANKRLKEDKKKQWSSSRDNLPELNEIVETLSCPGVGNKHRPWYRRARTSVQKLLHRLCVCGREHR